MLIIQGSKAREKNRLMQSSHSKFFINCSMFFALSFPSASNLHAALPEKPLGVVSDFAGVMDEKTKSALNVLATEVEQKTSVEIAVVTIKSLEGSDIESAAVDLFKKWGIGKKGKNNGILILMSMEDRSVRIEVGYGLEPIIPDGKAGEIIRNDMIPYFKQGSLGQGLLAGTLSVSSIVARDAGVSLTGAAIPMERPSVKRSLFGSLFQLIFLVLAIILFIRNPFLFLFFMGMGGGGGYRSSGSGGFGNSFGGFGGGLSGGGGASGKW